MNKLFTEDFCNRCGGRFNVDDMEDYGLEDASEPTYLCPTCVKEAEVEYKVRMAQYNADELAWKQDSQ